MDVMRSLFNSVVFSVFSVLLNVFFSSWVGYALAKLEFPLERVVFFNVLAPMILPQQLLMIPLFLQVDRLGLLSIPTPDSSFPGPSPPLPFSS